MIALQRVVRASGSLEPVPPATAHRRGDLAPDVLVRARPRAYQVKKILSRTLKSAIEVQKKNPGDGSGGLNTSRILRDFDARVVCAGRAASTVAGDWSLISWLQSVPGHSPGSSTGATGQSGRHGIANTNRPSRSTDGPSEKRENLRTEAAESAERGD
jgi:hypothetical protein